MAKLVVTIDGPAASGKSTVAKRLAERLGAEFLDTGAMYRAVTLAAMQADVDMEDEGQLLDVLRSRKFNFEITAGRMHVVIDGVDVTETIRDFSVTANAKYIACRPCLRAELVKMQRKIAVARQRIVTEGRDQGTVAFADADVKFFLTASLEERARRRQVELVTKGQKVSLDELCEAIEARDKSDESRDVGPLKPAEDAIVIDTTDLNLEQVVDKLMDYIQKNAARSN